MKIPLSSFEQVINEPILGRGLRYFEDGAVMDFTELESGTYEATVCGSEDYTVHLQIINNNVVKHRCDCPYDMGPICKHVVAVIFYVEQDSLKLAKTNTTGQKTNKPKSVTQQVNDLLNAISHEELMAFVKENSKRDKKFRNNFLVSFGHLNQEQSKEFYQKQIRSILRSAADRDGWLGWSEMKYVVTTIQPFLDNAEKDLEHTNFENVFFISTALLEEMTVAFQYADDSNGDLGYFIDEAMELLYSLVKNKLSDTLKQDIFEYCIATFNKKLFEGWDWHIGIIGLAADIVHKKSDVDRILDCLASVDGRYEKEQAQTMTLEILKRFKDKGELEKFVQAHISNPSIRTKEIEFAFKNKDYNRVIALSQDGITYDAKDKPGLVKTWYNWLLKVAQKQKDTPKIIAYARYLCLDNFSPEKDYYKILKETVDPTDWNKFLEAILTEITPKDNWKYSSLIRTIYIKEQWWDRLFLMLKQNCSLENISQNEQYLSKDYTHELLSLYRERLMAYVDRFVGRNHYQTACTYLRRMKKLGGDKEVKDLITYFRENYPQRKALLDELNRV